MFFDKSRMMDMNFVFDFWRNVGMQYGTFSFSIMKKAKVKKGWV